MRQIRKLGGIAALIEAATFIVGFALFLTLLGSADYANLDVDPVEHAQFLVDNELTMYVWNLIIYVLFGIVLVVLTLALYELLKASAPSLAQAGAAFGLIWAGLVVASGMVANIGAAVVVDIYADDPERAGSTWLALHFVTDGLGGGNEVVGGIWLVLVALAARSVGLLPSALNYVGLAAGAAGILTVIPTLGEPLGAIFGLGLIAWFCWAGLVLLRGNEPEGQAAAPRDTAVSPAAPIG